jgi:hypothetical protein
MDLRRRSDDEPASPLTLQPTFQRPPACADGKNDQ